MKLNKLDAYLIFVWAFALAYTIAYIFAFYRFGFSFDSTITACVFGGTIAETGAAARIKNVTERNKERIYTLEDREYFDKKEREQNDQH